jgi:hypothetical protein
MRASEILAIQAKAQAAADVSGVRSHRRALRSLDNYHRLTGPNSPLSRALGQGNLSITKQLNPLGEFGAISDQFSKMFDLAASAATPNVALTSNQHLLSTIGGGDIAGRGAELGRGLFADVAKVGWLDRGSAFQALRLGKTAERALKMAHFVDPLRGDRERLDGLLAGMGLGSSRFAALASFAAIKPPPTSLSRLFLSSLPSAFPADSQFSALRLTPKDLGIRMGFPEQVAKQLSWVTSLSSSLTGHLLGPETRYAQKLFRDQLGALGLSSQAVRALKQAGLLDPARDLLAPIRRDLTTAVEAEVAEPVDESDDEAEPLPGRLERARPGAFLAWLADNPGWWVVAYRQAWAAGSARERRLLRSDLAGAVGSTVGLFGGIIVSSPVILIVSGLSAFASLERLAVKLERDGRENPDADE